MKQLQLLLDFAIDRAAMFLDGSSEDEYRMGRYDEAVMFKQLIENELEKARLHNISIINGNKCWMKAVQAMEHNNLI